MPTPKVCCLSEQEATLLTQHQVRPDCRAHLHISRKEAREWADASYGPQRRQVKTYGSSMCPQTVVTYHQRSQARWLGSYLVIEALRTWTKTYRAPEDSDRSIIGGPKGQRGPQLATLQLRA